MTAHALQSEPDPASSQPPSQLRPAPGQAPVRSRTRATWALYAACARALDDERVIWDIGCGDGQGTSLLASEGRSVVGIEPNPTALEAARATERNGVQFLATPPRVTTPDAAPDLIVISNVLGYVEQPDALMLDLALCSKDSTVLLLWEPKSDPTQQLPPDKLRGYSPRELAELAAIAGWQPRVEPSVSEVFACLSATRASHAVVETLARLASQSPESDSDTLDLTAVSPELAASVHLRRARNALRARDGNAMTSHLLAALNVSPTHSEALCGLAHLALSSGGAEDALHFLRTCLDSDPTNVAALQLWVRFLDAAGPREQLAGLQTLANLNPADATVLSTLAQLNAENGDALLAIEDLERLRRYHPQPSLDLSLTLGWLLHSVGRKLDAEVEARLAAVLAPDAAEVRELLEAIEAS